MFLLLLQQKLVDWLAVRVLGQSQHHYEVIKVEL